MLYIIIRYITFSDTSKEIFFEDCNHRVGIGLLFRTERDGRIFRCRIPDNSLTACPFVEGGASTEKPEISK